MAVGDLRLDGAAEFDYVIVGGGAAGCLLAARLSEDREVSVCLLEAGPGDRHPFIAIPAGFTRILGHPRYSWNFLTEPAPATNQRAIALTQGRTLGGSTSVNGMIFTRGQARDYDAWAALGNPGWSYEEVLPYFKKLENRAEGDPAWRGRSGELTITDAMWRNPAIDAFMAAAQASGIPLNRDYNAASQGGVAITQQTVARGRRMSSSAAFLRPHLGRPNLEVRVESTATQLLFEGRRAVGVAYRRGAGGVPGAVRARREVIVSSGTINTARLLQVSGIGDAVWLNDIGVDVVHHLPGVGRNLQDHYLARVVARGKNFRSLNELAHGVGLVGQIARWLVGLPSVLTVCPSLVHFFFSSGVASCDIDLQGLFVPANYKGATRELDDLPGMTCAVWQHRPLSRGFVRARGRDIDLQPLIQPNYLAEEEDRRVLLAGMRRCRNLLSSPQLAPLVHSELQPGLSVASDEQWLHYAAQSGSTVYHPVGTAKMGPEHDPMSVVDAELRVRGMQALRVVDASVIPLMPSANTAAPTMMVAEKAAALIRRRTLSEPV